MNYWIRPLCTDKKGKALCNTVEYLHFLVPQNMNKSLMSQNSRQQEKKAAVT